MSFQAKLESPLKTTVHHRAFRTKAKSKMGLTKKSPTRGLRKMVCLTLVQVGLKPKKEHIDPSSAYCTSSVHNHSPINLQALSMYNESLTLQSTTALISPCSTSSVPSKELQPPHLPTLNDVLPPSNPLKRKVMEKELVFFAKRFKIATRGPKPIYFHPETVALIPQSSLEYFILKESQKTEDGAHNGKSFYHNLLGICSHINENTTSTSFSTEEAGLIMPPPSPWSYAVGTVGAFATPRQFKP